MAIRTARKLLFGITVFAGLTSLPIVYGLVSHEIFGDKRPYNPEIHDTLKQLMLSCSARPRIYRTVRCDIAAEQIASCLQSDYCDLDDLYNTLVIKLEFNLPPLRLDLAAPSDAKLADEVRTKDTIKSATPELDTTGLTPAEPLDTIGLTPLDPKD